MFAARGDRNVYGPSHVSWGMIAMSATMGDLPVHDPRHDQRSSGPRQRITREEALRASAMENAWLTFEEDKNGSIEVGKLADLLVLSDASSRIPKNRSKARRC